MSIHVVVPCNTLTHARKFFLYEKGRYAGISLELRDQFPTFESRDCRCTRDVKLI